MAGAHLLSHWARTQATVALSSAEAEMNASLKACSEGLFLQNNRRELGQEWWLELHGDSSACKGILDRTGAGALKHVSVRQLWLQEHTTSGRIAVHKIPRSKNASDALTHHWDGGAQCHFRQMGLRIQGHFA